MRCSTTRRGIRGTSGEKGWTAQFYGETHDRQDDVPGTSGNRADFHNLQTKNCHDCAYGDPDDIQGPFRDVDAYKFNWINRPVHMEIWTAR